MDSSEWFGGARVFRNYISANEDTKLDKQIPCFEGYKNNDNERKQAKDVDMKSPEVVWQ